MKLKTKASVSKRRLATASFLALSTAGVAAMLLPVSVFQASAIVAIDEPSTALRLATARSAADFAVSKPVIQRAAAFLNGTDMPAPAPALADKIKVAAGLSGATSAVARLTEALGSAVKAQAGDGLVEVSARSEDAVLASRIATALGDALVSEEELGAATLARHHESATTSMVESRRTASRQAHVRLAAFGASEIDPSEALASAAAAARSAEARLAAVHTVIEAGSPPLGAGRELPQGAATLQQTYWDLKKQLDKASETLGERHTTVIALRDGVARAAASLTAEWGKIERAAASEASVARSREAVLRRTVASADPNRSAAEDARSAVRLADAALARAEADRIVAGPHDAPFRLVAPAAIPATAVGFGAWQRALLAGGAGLTVFTVALLPRRRRKLPGAGLVAASRADKAPAAGAPVAKPLSTRPEPVTAAAAPTPEALDTLEVPVSSASIQAAADPVHAASPTLKPWVSAQASTTDQALDGGLHEQSSYNDFDADWLRFELDDYADERISAMAYESASVDASAALTAAEAQLSSPIVRALDPDLRDALRAIAAGIGGMESVHAAPPTVMVASNVAGADTGAIALALGEVAAELGYRVLVIEAESARANLAEAVAPDGDPVLVDAFGALRVALPAESAGGLMLAPAFRDGARIAAALARNTQAVLVDDLAAAFDVVIVNGGRASDSAEAGWTADAFIRVGRFASQRDDDHLLGAFHASSDAMLGTVAAGRFVAFEEPAPELRIAAHPVMRPISTATEAATPRRIATSVRAPLRMPPRRRIAAR